jgi:N-acetylmuramoyl-L-alanine amidase
VWRIAIPTENDRRKFLRTLAWGAASAGSGLLPRLLLAQESAFDLALEGQDLLSQGQFDRAAKALERATALDPENTWILEMLGRSYYRLGRRENAVEIFRKIRLLEPDNLIARAWVEMLTQTPLERKPKERTMTPLEREADAEEKAMLSKLEGKEGVEYQMRRVVIDPGHGGFDSGAVGLSGLKEADVNLQVGKQLADSLNSRSNIQAFLTRRGDYFVPLSERTVVANQYRADLFVSIHINANENRTAKGSETYFCAEKASSEEAQRVAEFENSVIKYEDEASYKEGMIDLEDLLFRAERKLYWRQSERFAVASQKGLEKNSDVKSRGIHSANFYVLKKNRMPSILLEVAFISNPEEEALLKKPEFISATVKQVTDQLLALS